MELKEKQIYQINSFICTTKVDKKTHTKWMPFADTFATYFIRCFQHFSWCLICAIFYIPFCVTKFFNGMGQSWSVNNCQCHLCSVIEMQAHLPIHHVLQFTWNARNVCKTFLQLQMNSNLSKIFCGIGKYSKDLYSLIHQCGKM